MDENLLGLDEALPAINVPEAVATPYLPTIELPAVEAAVNTERRDNQPDRTCISPAKIALSATLRSPNRRHRGAAHVARPARTAGEPLAASTRRHEGRRGKAAEAASPRWTTSAGTPC